MNNTYKLIGVLSIVLIPCMYEAQLRNFLKKPEIFFQILVDASNSFNNNVCRFPTQNNRISQVAGKDQVRQRKIVEHAIDTYPLIHKDVLACLNKFLEFKKQHGTEVEKKLYSSMTLEQFIMRLLEKRPLMFMAPVDKYLLQNGVSGHGGFEKIGTKEEQKPLTLEDYLSYDEMSLAALIGMSVPTYFINNGTRNNQGTKMAAGSFEEEGVYVGLVGARFEKPDYMEWQHMIITPQQNIAENGYGFDACDKGLLAIWSNLYGFKFPTFAQAQQDTTGRFILLKNGFYFDTVVYKKRIRLVVEPFLKDANTRAQKLNKKAYVHVVGLGLGVWQIDKKQEELMLEVYDRLMCKTHFSYISDIDFSWFSLNSDEFQKIRNRLLCKSNNNGHINIHFSKRNPADKLTGDNTGKLLVAMYAWDGNAYPGNEYWFGMLAASGDPAAACCSTIAELQNSKINFYIKENIEKMMADTQKKVVRDVKKSTKSLPALSWWERTKGYAREKLRSWWKKVW